MRLAMVGLGRMGCNMARRLLRAGIEVVGVDRSYAVTEQLAREEGLVPAHDLLQAVQALGPPRVVWLMLPEGQATERTLGDLVPLLEAGDVVVDGGNANYHDTLDRAALASRHDLELVDVGTSGGVWGLEAGYCLMAGGDASAVEVVEPAFRALAPSPDHGWAHVGPVGAGHYTKMVHNGIEYAMMQAMAEGLAMLDGKLEFELDTAEIAELWRHGSVVRGWLLDLTAQVLAQDPELSEVAPVVAESGEGRWCVHEAIDQGLAAPVLSLALATRFASQDERGYGNRLLAAMRAAFGGHHLPHAKD